MEGNLRFKIDWASLIVEVNLLFLYLRAIFQVQAPGELILFWRGDLTEGFFSLFVWGLIFGGAYFRNFTVFKKILLDILMALNCF